MNHYRLLGIPLLTADPDVIENAAEQRMSHVRSFQQGQHAEDSQRILTKLSHAKACLLDPVKKAAYDRQMGKSQPPPVANANKLPKARRLNAGKPPVVELIEAELVHRPDPPTPRVTRHAEAKKKQFSPGIEATKIVLGGIAGLFIGYLMIGYFIPNSDFLGIFSTETTSDEEVTPAGHNEPRRQVVSRDNFTKADVKPTIESPKQPRARAADTRPTESRPSDFASANQTVPMSNQSSPNKPPATVATVESEPSLSAEERIKRELDELSTQHEAAVSIMSVKQARALAREIANLTNEDAFAAEADTVARMLESVKDSEQKNAITRMLLSIMEQAIDEKHRVVATSYQNLLLETARESGDPDLISRVTLAIVKARNLK